MKRKNGNGHSAPNGGDDPLGELNPKQQRFVLEFLVDLNGKQAAIRAGYAPNSAEVQASQLLSVPKVRAAVEALKAKRAERTGVDADRVIRELERIGFSDMRKLMTWGPSGVRLLPSDQLDDDAALAVSEVSETTTEHGGSIKLKVHDKHGALTLLGKHLGLFPDRKELTGAGGKDLIPLDAIREILGEEE